MTGRRPLRAQRRPPRILAYEEQDQLEAGSQSVLVPPAPDVSAQIQAIRDGRRLPAPAVLMDRFAGPQGQIWERAAGRRCPDGTMNGLCTWNDGGICRAHPPGECLILADTGGRS